LPSLSSATRYGIQLEWHHVVAVGARAAALGVWLCECACGGTCAHLHEGHGGQPTAEQQQHARGLAEHQAQCDGAAVAPALLPELFIITCAHLHEGHGGQPTADQQQQASRSTRPSAMVRRKPQLYYQSYSSSRVRTCMKAMAGSPLPTSSSRPRGAPGPVRWCGGNPSSTTRAIHHHVCAPA
jgi:hypothetical protein